MLRFAALVVVVILYGSLFPFDFRAGGGPLVAIDHLLHAWTPDSISLANVISNVLLYMPLGFALACSAVSRIGRTAALAVATLLGALLSIGVELAQHYLPSRVTDLPDVLSNTTGTILGGVVGAWCGHREPAWGGRAMRIADPIAFLLAGAWIADRLWPFAPTLDVAHIKDALEPLLLRPQLVLVEVVRDGTCWLAFGALLQAAIPGRLSRTIAVAAMLVGLFVPLALEGRAITASSVLGAMLAVLAWFALSRRSATAIARVLAILLAGILLCVGIAPYEFTATSRPFDWIPFHDYMDSSILSASAAFLAKAFLYGTAVWATARAGLGLIVGGGLVTTLLLAIGWAQTYLPGRSAGITDATIAVCMTLAIQFLRTPAPRAVEMAKPMPAQDVRTSAAMLMRNPAGS